MKVVPTEMPRNRFEIWTSSQTWRHSLSVAEQNEIVVLTTNTNILTSKWDFISILKLYTHVGFCKILEFQRKPQKFAFTVKSDIPFWLESCLKLKWFHSPHTRSDTDTPSWVHSQTFEVGLYYSHLCHDGWSTNIWVPQLTMTTIHGEWSNMDLGSESSLDL